MKCRLIGRLKVGEIQHGEDIAAELEEKVIRGEGYQ